MDACSFSHNRGGEKKKCGRTRGSNSVTALGVGQHTTLKPAVIGR